MRLTSSFSRLALGLAITATSLFTTASSGADELLTVGSKAPALDIEHWVSDRDGEMPKVTKFEDGKIYIIEFWATWCGPCISSMPHLAEMQEKYADDGVQLISVSREDLETVEKFLKRDVRGEKDVTYGELTSAYCLTCDPDSSVSKEYMRAAHQNGIPTAFIVGKTGLIEYIGHPMSMEKVLKQIVADKWDREPHKKEVLAEQQAGIVMNEVGELQEAGKTQEAYDKISEFIDAEKKAGNPPAMQAMFARFSIGMELGGEAGAKAMTDIAEMFADRPEMINQITWSVVQMVQTGEKVDPQVLKATCDVAKQGVMKAKEAGNDEFTAAMLDTHANLLFLCEKLDMAIAVQKEAVELHDDKQLQDFLDKLMEAKKEKEGDDDDAQ